MKKITLFLLSLFLTVGAMAQIQSSTTDAIHLYKIKNKRNIYMAAHSNPTQENYGRFAFYAVEGKENTYKIYSYDANLWLSYTKAAGYSNAMNFVSFASTQDAANEWYVAKSGEYYQVAPYNTAGVAGKYWNFFGGIAGTYYSYDDYRNTLGLYEKGAAADDGSAWVFEAVDANDYTAPVAINYELKDGNGNVYSGTYTGVAGRTRLFTHKNTLCPITDATFEGNTYKASIAIPFHTSGVVISTFNTDNLIRLSVKEGKEIATKTVPTKETINNYLWDICPSFANGTLTFSIKHVATNKFLYTTATSRAHDDATVTLADEGTQFVYVANNGFKYGNLWLSTNSRNNDEQCMGMWDSQHDGAKHLIHKVNNFAITDAAGNVYEGGFNGYGLKNEAFLPAFTGVDAGAQGATLSNKTWSSYNFNATIDFKYPVSKVGETPNEILLDLYRSQDKTTAKYLRAVGNRVKVQPAETVAVDVNAHWAIYPSYENGKFNFAIMNIATGKYIYSDAVNNSSKLGDDSDVTLNAEGSKFIIAGDGNDFRFADRENLYLSINSDRDADVLLGVHRSAHGGTQMSATAVTSYGVKVGETTYATFYAPKAVTIPENVEAFAVTAINDGWVTLTKIENTIPANTGVVLKATVAGVYNFAIAEDVEEVENLLEGTVVATMVNGAAYVLGINDGEVGFYTAITEGQEEGTFLNNGYKAYLPVVAGASLSANLRFDFGGTTGIEEVEIRNEKEEIYDLTGRRVNEITKAGVYIIGGKKTLVK